MRSGKTERGNLWSRRDFDAGAGVGVGVCPATRRAGWVGLGWSKSIGIRIRIRTRIDELEILHGDVESLKGGGAWVG